jgi:hypothetical protein
MAQNESAPDSFESRDAPVETALPRKLLPSTLRSDPRRHNDQFVTRFVLPKGVPSHQDFVDRKGNIAASVVGRPLSLEIYGLDCNWSR